MGIIQKDTIRITLISYIGLMLGYLNKGVLFLIFLTTDQIGLLGLIVSVGVLFSQFSNLGLAYAVWRFFPFLRNGERKHFGFFQLSIYLNLIGVIVFTLVAVIFKDFICSFYIEKSSGFVSNYYWFLPIGISYSFFQTIDSFLRSLHKNVASVLATELFLRLAMTLAIGMYAIGWINFYYLMVLQSFSFVLPSFIGMIQLYRYKEFRLNYKEIDIPKRLQKIIFQFSLFSYFNFIGILIVTTIDTVMVASMLGLEETGVFTTMVFIISGLLVPYKSLLRVSSPFVAKYWKEKSMKDMQRIYSRVSSIGLVLGLFMYLIFWSCRNEIVDELPGSFANGIPVFLMLMIGRLIDMYCGINGVIFVTSKKFRYDLIFTIVLLVLVIGLNLKLIPIYGILGSAISTTVAYVIYNLARLAFVYFAYNLHPFKRNHLYVFLLFLFVMCGLEFFPGNLISNNFLFIAVKSIVGSIFFLFPIVFFNLEPDMVGYLNSLMKKIKKTPK